MDIDIETVETKRQLLAFVRFPHELYRGNRYYVPNLDLDELRILDPNRNPSFGFCRAKYWLAIRPIDWLKPLAPTAWKARS